MYCSAVMHPTDRGTHLELLRHLWVLQEGVLPDVHVVPLGATQDVLEEKLLLIVKVITLYIC